MIRAEWTNNDALSAEQTTQTNQMVEPRYIKATDVISILSLFYNYRTDAERYDLALAISAVPTADVVERKKGKWLDNETSYSDDVPQTCTCSVCGIRSRRPIGDFCKWCGADMRDDTDNQITVCPMCPDCPDNCPLGSDMRKEIV